MTLMPVSNISMPVAWSSNGGASRWIGQRMLGVDGPRSSTGSPRTFMMRPRVSRPTGTVIGAPVSMAFMPRTMPSVGFMAMQRTWFSPMCCATSTMTSIGTFPSSPSSTMRMALWIAGKMSLGELDVDGRADDLDDACRSVVRFGCHVVSVATMLSDLRHRPLSSSCSSLVSAAAAPHTISMISFVIDGLADAVVGQGEVAIMSEAFFVADSIAVMRAPCSAAADSSRTR